MNAVLRLKIFCEGIADWLRGLSIGRLKRDRPLFSFLQPSQAGPDPWRTERIAKVVCSEFLLVDECESTELQTSGTAKRAIQIPLRLNAMKADSKVTESDAFQRQAHGSVLRLCLAVCYDGTATWSGHGSVEGTAIGGVFLP